MTTKTHGMLKQDVAGGRDLTVKIPGKGRLVATPTMIMMTTTTEHQHVAVAA